MPSISRAITTLALVSLASTATLWAHPHVFIDSRLEFEMRGKECVGIWVEWTFDPVFSADIIGQFDHNRDGRFDMAENETVRAKAFSNLKKYGYFTFLRRGGTRVCPESVEGFQASQRDGRAIYRFRVPLEGKGFSQDFSVATFDATFYCATRYLQEPATIVWLGERPAAEPRIEVAPNEKYPVYYNPMGGTGDSRVYLKWEKGLETAYPEEISVSFE